MHQVCQQVLLLSIQNAWRGTWITENQLTSSLSQPTISPYDTWLHRQYLGSLGSYVQSADTCPSSTTSAAALPVEVFCCWEVLCVEDCDVVCAFFLACCAFINSSAFCVCLLWWGKNFHTYENICNEELSACYQKLRHHTTPALDCERTFLCWSLFYPGGNTTGIQATVEE